MHNLDKCEPASNETPGVQAIQEARRRVIERITSTSKELGNIAAQYGGDLRNYQTELNQLDASLARLQPVSSVRDAAGQAPNLYNKY